jgi:hypothetical protein
VGNKYRNLALQVGRVLKIETIRYVHESVGLRSEKVCAGDARQKLKSTNQTSRQKGPPISTNQQLSKIIKERREKFGRGSLMSA